MQHPSDISSALTVLRHGQLVREGAALETTDRGSRVRQEIEDETDRRFFAPWPDSVGREGAWIRAQLAAVNAALAPT